MSILATFTYGATPVRTLLRDGETWFVAADVCSVLGIAHASSSLRFLDDDEKGVHTMHTPGGNQDVAVINEPGLYSLVLRSRKPEAKAFKRWVTHEVLPQIRKTGGYRAPLGIDDDPIVAALGQVVEMRKEQLAMAQRIEELESAARAMPELPYGAIDPDSLSVSEAARMLDGRWQTVVALCEAGELVWFRQAARRRIVTESLKKYLRDPEPLAPEDDWIFFYKAWFDRYVYRPVTTGELSALATDRGLLKGVFAKSDTVHGRATALGRALEGRTSVVVGRYRVKRLPVSNGYSRFCLEPV